MLFKSAFWQFFIQIMGYLVTEYFDIPNLKQNQLVFCTFDSWDRNFHHCHIYLRMGQKSDLKLIVILFKF